MDEKKDNDNDELVEIDLKSMTDKQKKKLIDFKKEQSKIEKDKSKIEVDILKKMVDEMKEGKKEDEEEDNGDDDDDETDEAGLTILSMYEEIKKKQEETDVHLKANQLLFNMIFGLQSSSSIDKETDGFVADGQEKRNDITQQILIKAAKVDEMERKHKQYQTVFKDLFGATPDKTSTKTDSVSNRKRPSSGAELDSAKKKKKTTKSSSIQDALLLTLDQLKKSKSTR